MRRVGFCHATVVGFGILAFCGVGAARAQVPYEPAEINACVCLQLASAALAADKDAKSQRLAAANQQLADLDAQLAAARSRIDVNNPDAVARYNATVDEHNRRCAGRPFSSDLVAQIQAHPNCPPLQ